MERVYYKLTILENCKFKKALDFFTLAFTFAYQSAKPQTKRYHANRCHFRRVHAFPARVSMGTIGDAARRDTQCSISNVAEGCQRRRLH